MAPLAALPLRLPIQDVYKFDNRRILAGRIASGRLKVGDTLLFSPSNKTAKVASIEAWSAPVQTEAEAGQSVGLTLDEQLFIERGELASHVNEASIESHVFRAKLFWLSKTPLKIGETYRLRLQTRDVAVMVESILNVYDPEHFTVRPSDVIGRNDIAEVTLRSAALLSLDAAESYQELPALTGAYDWMNHFMISGLIIFIPRQRNTLRYGCTFLQNSFYIKLETQAMIMSLR